ncbi:MarR family winged helix-turn-helix transcriptional regulator [Alkalibacterium sp. 20]|uniref:MarR family winged helix-turn-helix transcriptional regulator n=1 Tax=Alkalibacterium sp. 20 TaxID=1798803 RepID=UPI0008FFEC93|nr:MarR family transcriptional regulator [Alkalibacterium sp. 20]OJF94621.1 MarR family transcriptional regulator [Alkalibacterium sp. 20]
MVDILRDIGVIARSLDSIANIEFKDLDLTRGQYLYVVRIDENPGIIPDRLADMIKVDRTTASRAINKLEKQRFIEKREDPENKKIKRLFATEKGAEAAEYIRRENTLSSEVALDGLTQEEARNLSVLLKKVKRNVESDWNTVKKGKKRAY